MKDDMEVTILMIQQKHMHPFPSTGQYRAHRIQRKFWCVHETIEVPRIVTQSEFLGVVVNQQGAMICALVYSPRFIAPNFKYF